MVDLSKFEALPWRSGVPSDQDLVANQNNPARLAANQIYRSFQTTEIAGGRAWLSRSKRVAAAVASLSALAAFDTLVNQLDDLGSAAMAWGDAARAAVNGDYDAVMGAALQSAQDAVLKSVAEAPILGAVAGLIGLGVNVGRAVWYEARGSEGPQMSQPLALNRQADQEEGERIMGALTGADWTGIFLPEHDPTGGGYLQYVDVKYPTNHKGQVFWIGKQDGEVDYLGEGLVPGCASLARMWQIRLKQASTGSTRLDGLAKALKIPVAMGKGFEELTVYGLGYFRPSLPQISQILWAQINKPGPDMFRVDALRLLESWDHYWKIWLLTLSQLLQAGEKDDAEVVWRVLTDNWVSTDTFADWPNVNRPDLVTQLPEEYRDLVSISLNETGKKLYLGEAHGGWVNEVAPEYGAGLSWYVTNRGVTRRYCQNLRDRQAQTLRTLEVAYLTGDEPGLSGDLKDKFEKARTMLLGHSDRRKVDMARVPPGPWRDELVKRRKGLIKEIVS